MKFHEGSGTCYRHVMSEKFYFQQLCHFWNLLEFIKYIIHALGHEICCSLLSINPSPCNKKTFKNPINSRMVEVLLSWRASVLAILLVTVQKTVILKTENMLEHLKIIYMYQCIYILLGSTFEHSTWHACVIISSFWIRYLFNLVGVLVRIHLKLIRISFERMTFSVPAWLQVLIM